MGLKSNRLKRINAVLNPYNGAVHYMMRSRITVPSIIAFYEELTEKYPNQTIYMIQDNWPVHYHPNVVAALEPQKWEKWFNVPPSWKDIKVKERYKKLKLSIQLVPLPTYSPWLNTIEKLGLALNKDIIHHHSYTDQFQKLTENIQHFLDQYKKGSEQLLKFVGLKCENGIYQKTINKQKIK